jgi:hypothetical protein
LPVCDIKHDGEDFDDIPSKLSLSYGLGIVALLTIRLPLKALGFDIQIKTTYESVQSKVEDKSHASQICLLGGGVNKRDSP